MARSLINKFTSKFMLPASVHAHAAPLVLPGPAQAHAIACCESKGIPTNWSTTDAPGKAIIYLAWRAAVAACGSGMGGYLAPRRCAAAHCIAPPLTLNTRCAFTPAQAPQHVRTCRGWRAACYQAAGDAAAADNPPQAAAASAPPPLPFDGPTPRPSPGASPPSASLPAEDVLECLTAECLQQLHLPAWRALVASLLSQHSEQSESPSAAAQQAHATAQPPPQPPLLLLHGRLGGFLQGSAPHFPSMALEDFSAALALCAAAGHVPSKEDLAALIYADSGGCERFFKEVRRVRCLGLPGRGEGGEEGA